VQQAQEEHGQRARAIASGHLQVVANAAAATGIVCDTVHAMNEHPYKAIIETATSKGAI
jgi:hypothetical protein